MAITCYACTGTRAIKAFATDLAQAAADGLQFNETQSGLKADTPIDIYIYASTDDLQEAILYEPSWTGGQAFPDQDIVILGISPNLISNGGRMPSSMSLRMCLSVI